MKPGPRPTPTDILQMSGSQYASKRGNEPRPRGGCPVKPKWLNDREGEIWDEHVELLMAVDVLTVNDGAALAALCTVLVDLEWANETIAKEGRTSISKNGALAQHPALLIKYKALDAIRKFASMFGLAPSERTGLETNGSEEVEEEFTT
jgi:P27 family predicted phage terminase small subunit